MSNLPDQILKLEAEALMQLGNAETKDWHELNLIPKATDIEQFQSFRTTELL